MNCRTMSISVLGLTLGHTDLHAEAIDGSQALICAAIETSGCGPQQACAEATAEDLGIPRFFRVDFEKQTVQARRVNGEERTSAIQSQTGTEGGLVLQGVQGELGWTMAIGRTNGSMTITAASQHDAFVIFGAYAAH